MQTFTKVQHGYRGLTSDEIQEFNATEDRRWGWMRYVALHMSADGTTEYIVPWDCMIEFGMDHDHDPVVCESIMADMNPDYGVSEHYNNGVKEYY